jgi:hypothetical protein
VKEMKDTRLEQLIHIEHQDGLIIETLGITEEEYSISDNSFELLCKYGDPALNIDGAGKIFITTEELNMVIEEIDAVENMADISIIDYYIDNSYINGYITIRIGG